MVTASANPANMLAKTLRREIFIRSPSLPLQIPARLPKQRARREQGAIRTLAGDQVKG